MHLRQTSILISTSFCDYFRFNISNPKIFWLYSLGLEFLLSQYYILSSLAINFLSRFHFIILSTEFINILLNYLLFLESVYLISFFILEAKYFFPKSLRTLHFSVVCRGQWIKEVGGDSLPGHSIYLLLHLPVHPISGLVFDQVYIPLIFLLSWTRLVSDPIYIYIGGFNYPFINILCNFHMIKKY